MTPEQRLAESVTALEAVGLSCLILGGHASRYYGVNRTTNDFDLHLSPDPWPDLPLRLAQAPMFAGQAVVEGVSWRPSDFRRFQIGRLADGREEWLEFWRHNHLLAPFADLHARREPSLNKGLGDPRRVRLVRRRRDDVQSVGHWACCPFSSSRERAVFERPVQLIHRMRTSSCKKNA